jgi:hypothetical protein
MMILGEKWDFRERAAEIVADSVLPNSVSPAL